MNFSLPPPLGEHSACLDNGANNRGYSETSLHWHYRINGKIVQIFSVTSQIIRKRAALTILEVAGSRDKWLLTTETEKAARPGGPPLCLRIFKFGINSKDL